MRFRSFIALLVCALLLGCGGGGSKPPTIQQDIAESFLTASDVQSVINAAASAVNTPYVIAVTDRSGNILAVFRKNGAAATATGNFGATVDTNELAVALARTASFFSNDQAPLSSRTVRFISATHFPPGISFTASGPLYGIENTNRGCPLNVAFLPGQALPPARSISGATTGLGVLTGKADVLDSDQTAVNPGGVPLFKNGSVVGGVGVAGTTAQAAEFAAFRGGVGAGFGATPASPGVVIIDGVALPYVNQTTQPPGTSNDVVSGSFVVGPVGSAAPAPDGDLIAEHAGPLGGLSLADVQNLVQQAVSTASQTRAVIRLPDGSRARMAMAVAALDGSLLAVYRMHDATVFSVDVAAAKARNMVYFNTAAGTADLPGIPPGTAVTNRTISFGSQPMFPPGIDGSGLGPFFNLYVNDTANPCTQGSQPSNPNQSGVVFFPGAVPLYRNGVLVGGLGVSGDGVDQDDFVAGTASANFAAPANIRADQVVINGVTMPYLKYPRNPTQ